MRRTVTLAAVLLLCFLPVLLLTASAPPPTPAPEFRTEVAVVGDSVVITLALADNGATQPVGVDTVEFYTEIDRGVVGGITDTQTVRKAHVSPSTAGRLTYPLSKWGANETLGGRVGARLGRNQQNCTGGVCWSTRRYEGNPAGGSPAWSYYRDARAPNPPEAGKLTVPSVGLN